MKKTKLCKKCGEEVPLSEFYKDGNAKDGLRPKCKTCFNEDREASSKRRGAFLESAPAALSEADKKRARKHVHYKVAVMVADHYGKDMSTKEIAIRCGVKPSVVNGMAGFLRKNGIDIPKGLFSKKQPARYVALEDLRKRLQLK